LDFDLAPTQSDLRMTGWPVVTGLHVVGTLDFGPPPHSGSYQAFLPTGFGELQQSFATTLGQSYTVDFWAATASHGATLNVLVGSTVFSHIFAEPTGYTEFTFTFTAISTSSPIQFAVTGLFFLDDISVNPTGVGVPDGGTTVSLLGCGLLGLTALRRKLSC
jgi:VPDSG-CTERM motif